MEKRQIHKITVIKVVGSASGSSSPGSPVLTLPSDEGKWKKSVPEKKNKNSSSPTSISHSASISHHDSPDLEDIEGSHLQLSGSDSDSEWNSSPSYIHVQVEESPENGQPPPSYYNYPPQEYFLVKWSAIASQLPGRIDNEVKNYWNTKLKKKLIAGKVSLKTEATTSVSYCKWMLCFGILKQRLRLLHHTANRSSILAPSLPWHIVFGTSKKNPRLPWPSVLESTFHGVRGTREICDDFGLCSGA